MDSLKGLNEEQKKMVRAAEGPVLVLAGAGSGKTRALTHRVAYLMVEKGVDPENILAITFTNKAAGEIKERVVGLVKKAGLKPSSLPKMGTFHSVCAGILRKEAHLLKYPRSFVIFDEDDSKKVIRQVLVKLNLSDKKISPAMVKSLISGAKNNLIGPEEYADYAESFKEKSIVDIYRIYHKELKKNEAMDFDDLLMNVVLIFEKHPEILRKYQKIWRYILIDEYQDTNHAQYLFAKMLSQRHNNICVVGDDWQSVYSFRGANFQNILDFEKNWPQAKIFRLERNYRSTKTIISSAQSVIEKNKNRSAKELWTKNETGHPIEIYEADNEESEADFVVRTAGRLRSEGYKLSEMAVFYRINAQSRVIEEKFLQNKLPYKIVGGVRFYERKEIKDALAWLRVASGANDWVSLERSLMSPPSGIGKTSISRIREKAEADRIKISDLAKSDMSSIFGVRIAGLMKEYFKKIEKIKKAAKKSLSEAVELTIKTSGLAKHLKDGTFENEERVENLKELLSVAREREATGGKLTLNEFLEEVALVSDIDNYNQFEEGVTLMTLHTSKGLEYRVVFIVGLEEKIFPHVRSSIEPEDMEEERRIFYVGMTRAKELLYLTYARHRLYFGSINHNQPSRFIAELPSDLIKFTGTEKDFLEAEPKKTDVSGVFKVGDKIEHEFFGKGEIIEIIDDEITADFNVYGKKTVSVEYAPIRKC